MLVVLLPYWNALGMFRATMSYYQATWRNYRASGSFRQLGIGVLAGVEARGAGEGRVSADRHGAGFQPEWLSVVFHVDRAVALFLSESGVVDDQCFAVFVVRRVDRVWGAGGVSV